MLLAQILNVVVERIDGYLVTVMSWVNLGTEHFD
jgi:hypothetical protein